MYSEAAWGLVSSGTQVQLQILFMKYLIHSLVKCLSFFSQVLLKTMIHKHHSMAYHIYKHAKFSVIGTFLSLRILSVE